MKEFIDRLIKIGYSETEAARVVYSYQKRDDLDGLIDYVEEKERYNAKYKTGS